IAVVADASVLVGRDVGRIERAERQLEAEPAGKILAAGPGVAGHAIGGTRQIRAALDGACLGERGRDAGWTCTLVVSERDARSARKVERAGTADDPGAYGDRDDDDRSDAEQDSRSCTHAFFPAISLRSIGRRRSATPVAA